MSWRSLSSSFDSSRLDSSRRSASSWAFLVLSFYDYFFCTLILGLITIFSGFCILIKVNYSTGCLITSLNSGLAYWESSIDYRALGGDTLAGAAFGGAVFAAGVFFLSLLYYFTSSTGASGAVNSFTGASEDFLPNVYLTGTSYLMTSGSRIFLFT